MRAQSNPAWRAHALTVFQYVACALASVHAIRFYVANLPLGINLQDYVNGTAPLPFQKRYLSALILRGMMHVGPLVHLLEKHHSTLAPPLRGCWLILSVVSLLAGGAFTVLLYRRVSSERPLQFLVYPFYLAIMIFTFVLRVEQPATFPYDFLTVVFFAAGTYFIYSRRFLPLLVVMLLGTWNRETTAFLVPLFVIDSISVGSDEQPSALRKRFDLSRIPWLKAALLTAVWVCVEALLAHQFRFNNRDNTRLRYIENLQWLTPTNWPALFNVCGYLMPLVLLLQARLRPNRYANYAWIVVPWLIVMWMWALMVETRIYGELVPWVTVALVLLIEQYTASRRAFADGASPLPS